jgi:hypothetical protein
MNTCENCGREKLTMIYRGERWCCDNCRKQLAAESTRSIEHVNLHSYGPTDNPLRALAIDALSEPFPDLCSTCQQPFDTPGCTKSPHGLACHTWRGSYPTRGQVDW